MIHIIKRIFFSSFLLTISFSAFSQVTIGGSIKPNEGALLDLKEQNDLTGGATTTKGLAMPRVKILSSTITNPSTGVASTIDGAPTNELWNKDEHIGLLVYHVDGCSIQGEGLYVWSGETWTKLSKNHELAGLQLNTDNLLFYNGVNTPQSVIVKWNPTNNAPTYSGTGANFTFSPLSGTLPSSSPQTVNISVANMNESELSSNLFANKISSITFSLANSICSVDGNPETRTVNVNQVNKALKVDGKVIPDQVDITATGTNTIEIESNARWTFKSITPAASAMGAVTSVDLGITKGTELDNGNSETNTISYVATSAADRYRYNYLTFSDANASERFADVILTVAQCEGNNDLTMRQYVDLWEETFGMIPGVDEPNSDGDTTKNTRSVRWHYTRPDLAPNDPKQSIYFSALFATGRFMITNLQTKNYTPRTATPTVEWAGAPALTNSYAETTAPYKTAYWGYPNTSGESNAALDTQYSARERLGLLYNWSAATGNQNADTSEQYNTVFTTPIQGICPAGWHLPSSVEWAAFLADVSNNPTKYSTNTVTGATRAGITLKDMCEPYSASGRGQSFSLFDGGFDSLLGGSTSTSGVANGYGSFTYLWSASSQNTINAYTLFFIDSSGLVLASGVTRSNLQSVRCKMD